MVTSHALFRSYLVISTVAGCLSALELFTYVPRDSGDYSLSNSDDGGKLWQFDENSFLNISLFGSELSDNLIIFVSRSSDCVDREPLTIEYTDPTGAFQHLSGYLPPHKQSLYHICVLDEASSTQVSLPFTMHKIGFQIPVYVRVIVASFLLCLSGLFSGLNLGLMSLDLTSLRILIETGSTQEKAYARSIEPVRKQGNFLLCTLLLGNVLVNNTLTILLDTLFGGLVAVVGATAGIVVMGEIIPQAICQRFGLVVGAKTLFITKIFMVLTGPVSWPISKLLDVILGEELGIFYRREQLKELLKMTEGRHGMAMNEITMINGVLSINEKCVEEIMTNIEDVYMLNISDKLDFEVMQEIMSSGFSRIPVFEDNENNIVGLLFVKELAFVDPDDELPLESVVKFYNHTAHKVHGDMKVLELMQDFMNERYHMAIVVTVQEQEMKDNIFVPIGVVTLEDIIEEIIQQEIVDETDTYVNNDFKKKNEKKQLPALPFQKKKNQPVMKISPQLQLATFTFLSTQVEEFKEENISSNVLNKLIKQDIIREVEPGGAPVVEAGKVVDFMIMILTGELKIEVGIEKMTFLQGPFSTFCIPALRGPYTPDITVSPGDAHCQFLCIRGEEYRRALEATAITLEGQRDRPLSQRGTSLNASLNSLRSEAPAASALARSRHDITPLAEDGAAESDALLGVKE